MAPRSGRQVVVTRSCRCRQTAETIHLDLLSGQPHSESQLARQVPVVRVACKSKQDPRYEGVTGSNSAAHITQRLVNPSFRPQLFTAQSLISGMAGGKVLLHYTDIVISVVNMYIAMVVLVLALYCHGRCAVSAPGDKDV